MSPGFSFKQKNHFYTSPDGIVKTFPFRNSIYGASKISRRARRQLRIDFVEVAFLVLRDRRNRLYVSSSSRYDVFGPGGTASSLEIIATRKMPRVQHTRKVHYEISRICWHDESIPRPTIKLNSFGYMYICDPHK